MSKTLIQSNKIKHLALHKYKSSFFQHYNFPPFVGLNILNIAIFFTWHQHLHALTIVTVLLALLYVFTILLAYWNISIRTFMMYTRVNKIPKPKDFEVGKTKIRKRRQKKQSTNSRISKYYAHIIPHKHQGLEELVPLQYRQGYIFFEYQKRKYCFDSEEKQQFLRPEKTHKEPIAKFIELHGGIEEEDQLRHRKFMYGSNVFDIPLPSFLDVYKEHALKPFFVFQVFCVCLWLLDEMWYYSLFTLFMLFVFEATVVTQRINNLKFVRNMRKKPYTIRVKREGSWETKFSDQIFPHDIVSLRAGEFAPCDVLLLDGKAVADEALLTGESAPQVKESVRTYDGDHETVLDLKSNDFKRFVVFGGTMVLQTNISQQEISDENGLVKPGHEKKCQGIVLRTGFETNQGKLLRTILFSTEHMSVNNVEALLFILFLMIFAILASSYVFYIGIQDPDRSRWKLFLNCIMIITSVVPPELPMELSLAVNSSLMALQKHEIFCTEPFRIPLAGKIDVCCFDKTGTLTTEKMTLTQIVLPNGTTIETAVNLNENLDHPLPYSVSKRMKEELQRKRFVDVPFSIKRHLSSCHALIFHKKEIVGDPMEVAGLISSGYDYREDVSSFDSHDLKRRRKIGNEILPKKKIEEEEEEEEEGDDNEYGDRHIDEVRILRRFAFSSTLKRMGVVASVKVRKSGGGGKNKKKKKKMRKSTSYMVYIKGAAEVVEPMLKSVPKGYRSISARLAASGKRVIALAQKKVSGEFANRLKNVKRDETECDLEFIGFAVFDTDLKPMTKETIYALIKSDHHVVMITGDHPLTAIHVAKELQIVMTTKPIAIMKENGDWVEVGEGGEMEKVVDPGDMNMFELAITGDVLALQSEEWFYIWIPRINVFARTTPIQKEQIICTFKKHNFSCLMCGDGTNDVGGLKQAEIGIALLASPMDKNLVKKKKTVEEEEDDRKKVEEKAKSKKLNELMKDPNFRAKFQKMKFFEKMKFQYEMMKGGAQNAKIGNQSVTDILSESSEQPLVQLGDASVAAPFTSRKSSISSVLKVISQGRCTLVTTMQMYKILALHCLLMAYSLSVLYMMGVKFGDKQMLIQGVGIAVCFLFISRAPPIDHLDGQRPVTSIFAPSMVCSMLGQFFIHITNLVLVIHAARIVVPLTSSQKDLEGDYEKNLLNSVVFVMETLQAIVTFLVNYEGWPFMASMLNNKKLLFVILGMIGLVFVVANNWIPELNDGLEVVDFSDEFRSFLVKMMIADVIMVFLYERVVYYCFIKFSKFKKF